ncbi:hypothetical protein [Brachyspira aalborgi]|uniref:hypothetical protein n=1 Tax=Brachyspira aalborgi TaxID=29522 RepID=UPI0003A21E2C|nr:hypothetical protein [Brachyspira aalborgi]
MKLLKKITILLCFLSLIAFVSCSAEDKSGVKEKDNADGTEITGGGKSGTSGTGGRAGTGEGSGTGGTSETGGGSGTGGTETTEIGNFPPPAGTYKDKDGREVTRREVTRRDEETEIEGKAKNSEGRDSRFGFNITEWKKTTKDGKDIKLESVDATDAWGWGHRNISIVYYYDSSTLEITFKSNSGTDFLFKGTKQP